MLLIAINRPERVCDMVITKHNYKLMREHKLVMNIMLCYINRTINNVHNSRGHVVSAMPQSSF